MSNRIVDAINECNKLRFLHNKQPLSAYVALDNKMNNLDNEGLFFAKQEIFGHPDTHALYHQVSLISKRDLNTSKTSENEESLRQTRTELVDIVKPNIEKNFHNLLNSYFENYLVLRDAVNEAQEYIANNEARIIETLPEVVALLEALKTEVAQKIKICDSAQTDFEFKYNKNMFAYNRLVDGREPVDGKFVNVTEECPRGKKFAEDFINTSCVYGGKKLNPAKIVTLQNVNATPIPQGKPASGRK